MEQEELLKEYSEQTEQQKELIKCRYEFGLNEVKLRLPDGVELKDVTWLDIGSNFGIGISNISDEINIIASDKEIDYLKQCKEDSLQKIILSGANLPFESGSCKVVSCLETIEHLPIRDINNMLSEIYRVLSKDGIFLLSTPNRNANGKAKMSPDHFQEFTLTELYMLLNDHGFKIDDEYGQNFIKEGNLLHQTFRSLRENFLLRDIYYKLPDPIIRIIREKSLEAFGKGEIRKRNNEEIERIIYLISSKA